MRLDGLGPRSWLLGALAGWAVLVWLLSLVGLGGQVRPLPDDPALVGALPRLPGPAPQRLGPLSQYGEIAARPVFSSTRTPQPFFVSGQEAGDTAQTFDFILTSVLVTPNFRMAILQPSQGGEGIRLKVGEAPDSAPAWQLAQIDARSVVFQGPEGSKTLELRVFDGLGGQPPSATPPSAGGSGAQVPGASAGNPPAMPVAPPMSSPKPAQQGTQAPDPIAPANAAPENSLTTEQQMAEIRKRIEARREQLRQHGQSPPPSDNTK